MPGTSARVTMRASFHVLAQASLDLNYPFGWVIAAWVLGCRARIPGSDDNDYGQWSVQL